MSALSLIDNDLPVVAFREQIMACKAPYIIVVSDTGSGKTTEIPRWFHEAGNRVLVTEPLIETVKGTSEYVASLMSCQIGSRVGYRTGDLKMSSSDTELLFATDGLALVRQLSGDGAFNILVIDEIHEWNKNQSTLEAWAWEHLLKGDSPFKQVVVLSATIDAEALSAARGNAPIFKIPGRQFPILDRAPNERIEDDVIQLVTSGHDVLIFEPGKAEIANTIDRIETVLASWSPNTKVFPFHGEVDRADKDRAYESYPDGKVIVSTNALETGRTVVPSEGRKLAVIDTGMERRQELIDGIEKLVLAPIALSKRAQRRGRTGRVSEGVFIDRCGVGERDPEILRAIAHRPKYPTPEILRTRLDQTVLRLKTFGYDAAELPFFHELDHTKIEDAKRSLYAIGCFDRNGNVTSIGRKVSQFPCSVQYARMIVAAEELKVVDPVVTIAAVLEVGTLRARGNAMDMGFEPWRSFTTQTESDLIAELDLYRACLQARREVAQSPERLKFKEVLKERGIFGKFFLDIEKLRRKLMEVVRQQRVNVEPPRGGDTMYRPDEVPAILEACLHGMVDHVYRYESGSLKNGEDLYRELDKKSVVRFPYTSILDSLDMRPVTPPLKLVVGKPITISFRDKRGQVQERYLVGMATKVSAEMLKRIAPHLLTEERSEPVYDAVKDEMLVTVEVKFNGQALQSLVEVDANHPNAPAVFAKWLAKQTLLG